MNRQLIRRLPLPLRVPAQVLFPTGRHRPAGAIVNQRFVNCAECGVETAATVHGNGMLLCAEGHRVAGGDAS